MAAGSVCLFAHFDPAGRIAPHVLRYLANLAECGFAVHLACSGPAGPPDGDRAALSRLGIVLHLRPNAGLDFGAWQALLGAGCAEGAGEILLANDSVFGPFSDLRPLVAAMRRKGLDAWGMVASAEGAWHIQSWFLCLTAAALARPAVRRVLALPFQQMTKAEIVLHGELGLGVALAAEGLASGAVYEEPRRSRLRRLARINPTHLDWAFLVARGGVPFVKIELLRDNPIRIPWAGEWERVIGARSAYPLCLIRRHLPAPTPTLPPRWRTLLLYWLLTRDKKEALRASGRTLGRMLRRPR